MIPVKTVSLPLSCSGIECTTLMQESRVIPADILRPHTKLRFPLKKYRKEGSSDSLKRKEKKKYFYLPKIIKFESGNF